jgi:hypothetical protein
MPVGETIASLASDMDSKLRGAVSSVIDYWYEVSFGKVSIAGANITIRLLAAAGFTERVLERTLTAADGGLRISLSAPREARDTDWCSTEGVLSPTPGTTPAEAGPLKLQFA